MSLLLYARGGKRANESPDGKRSAPPMDTCNTRGVTDKMTTSPQNCKGQPERIRNCLIWSKIMLLAVFQRDYELITLQNKLFAERHTEITFSTEVVTTLLYCFWK
uniref:SFRICE_034009 n=1 Tax=Spodoptera frugiperda TaxID=7108 RepID=A0A2H1VE20_SPOFR